MVPTVPVRTLPDHRGRDVGNGPQRHCRAHARSAEGSDPALSAAGERAARRWTSPAREGRIRTEDRHERRGEAMARTYNVISCDGHLEIPPDPWTRHLPDEHKGRAPRLVKLREGGEG